MTDFIEQNGLRWEYETFGSGPHLLLAFHGFGNHGSDFRIFAPALQDRFTVISFTLPHHSKETTGSFYGQATPESMKNMISSFTQNLGADTFSIMGYSLGGKVALQLVELFPEQVRNLYLFAPDGIRPSLSNAFITRSALGKKVYGRIIENPSRLFRFMQLLEKAKLLNSKVGSFVRDSLSSREKRQLVWDVWMTFRDINPDIQKVSDIIRRQNINVHLFFGKYDRIIPPAVGEKFARLLQQPKALHIIDAGHNLYKENVMQELAKVVGG